MLFDVSDADDIVRFAKEVIELAPPAVQTELPRGQSAMECYMPLDEFIKETTERVTASETPTEVLTEKVLFVRNPEAEGRFEDALAITNQF